MIANIFLIHYKCDSLNDYILYIPIGISGWVSYDMNDQQKNGKFNIRSDLLEKIICCEFSDGFYFSACLDNE